MILSWLCASCKDLGCEGGDFGSLTPGVFGKIAFPKGDISKKGMTILPLKIYITEKGLIKVELGVGKHRKAHNKKELLKERDIARETRRELKSKR